MPGSRKACLVGAVGGGWLGGTEGGREGVLTSIGGRKVGAIVWILYYCMYTSTTYRGIFLHSLAGEDRGGEGNEEGERERTVVLAIGSSGCWRRRLWFEREEKETKKSGK